MILYTYTIRFEADRSGKWRWNRNIIDEIGIERRGGDFASSVWAGRFGGHIDQRYTNHTLGPVFTTTGRLSGLTAIRLSLVSRL